MAVITLALIALLLADVFLEVIWETYSSSNMGFLSFVGFVTVYLACFIYLKTLFIICFIGRDRRYYSSRSRRPRPGVVSPGAIVLYEPPVVSTLPFLRLPREIRDKVYFEYFALCAFTIASRHPDPHRQRLVWADPRDAAIFLICRQIAFEIAGPHVFPVRVQLLPGGLLLGVINAVNLRYTRLPYFGLVRYMPRYESFLHDLRQLLSPHPLHRHLHPHYYTSLQTLNIHVPGPLAYSLAQPFLLGVMGIRTYRNVLLGLLGHNTFADALPHLQGINMVYPITGYQGHAANRDAIVDRLYLVLGDTMALHPSFTSRAVVVRRASNGVVHVTGGPALPGYEVHCYMGSGQDGLQLAGR